MPTSEQVQVFAALTALPGKEAELRETLTALVAPTRAEPGNSRYMIHKDINKPATFWFLEIYTGKEAVHATIKSPYLAAALSKAKPILAAEPLIVSAKL